MPDFHGCCSTLNIGRARPKIVFYLVSYYKCLKTNEQDCIQDIEFLWEIFFHIPLCFLTRQHYCCSSCSIPAQSGVTFNSQRQYGVDAAAWLHGASSRDKPVLGNPGSDPENFLQRSRRLLLILSSSRIFFDHNWQHTRNSFLMKHMSEKKAMKYNWKLTPKLFN
jgi:hypothetical protein